MPFGLNLDHISPDNQKEPSKDMSSISLSSRESKIRAKPGLKRFKTQDLQSKQDTERGSDMNIRSVLNPQHPLRSFKTQLSKNKLILRTPKKKLVTVQEDDSHENSRSAGQMNEKVNNTVSMGKQVDSLEMQGV